MSPVRAPVCTLTDNITEAIRHLEPALSPESIRAAVEATTTDENQLAALASVVHHDITVLTGPAGTTCVADIEPLIRNIQDAGGTAVHVPRCVVCLDSDTEMYSRQLKARICRACALARYANVTAECVACGQLGRPTYRARRGGMHCRNCIPEPDVDHRSAVITGIAALSTGLSDEVIQQIADTFTTTAARRELNWILHDYPGVFTGTKPHESVRSVCLVEMLIAAGARHIQAPRCPVCSRQITLTNALDGQRCCARCWRRRCSRGACTRCGKQRHLHRLVGTDERLCTRCFEADPANHHVCSQCGQTRFIEHRDGNTMLCRRCYQKPSAVCGTCGGKHQCWRGPDGQMICSTCAAKQRAKEPCTVCGQLRQVHVRTDTGTAMCDRCGRKREPCARCGKVLPVSARLTELGPLCSACLKREPAFFRDCRQCGVHGRTYHRGLCPACACPAVLNDLFGRDGHLNPAAQQVVDVLLKCDATAVLRWVRKTRHSGLATAIRDTDCALTHQRFDQLPASKSREWLRNLLVDAAVLAHRDTYLVRTEEAINACIACVADRDDRAALRSYATWHHLRKLRAQADRASLKPGSGKGAQREIEAITAFLRYLHDSQVTLQSCRQHDVDIWSSQNPTKASLHQFLAWAARHGHAKAVRAHPKPTRRTRPVLPGEDQRWRLIQYLIQTPDLETRDRVAGLLVLLYSQPTARLVTIQLSDIEVHDDGRVTLRLGELPLTLPAPVDRLIVELTERRRGYAAVTAAANRWLFPGGRSGQHMSPQRMGHRLRQIGVPPRLARNTTLIDLAAELPAAVLSKLLGFSIKRAASWNIEAGNTNPRYAATVARREAVYENETSPCLPR